MDQECYIEAVMDSKYYDYIIAGAGASGLSLLVRLLLSKQFNDKRILLIDKSEKTTNDKTWCFWEKENGVFEKIVFRQWQHLNFYSDGFSKKLDILPYKYKMIRSSDFYNYCFDQIKTQPNVDIVYDAIEDFTSAKEGVIVKTSTASYQAKFIFNSIAIRTELKKGRYNLLQHFKGYIIETETDVFDENAATLMDFRIKQKDETRFVYVLPFDKKTALVEYTVFSESLLAETEYDEELKNYINSYITSGNYSIKDTEFGVIPMTDSMYKSHEGNIIHIGTAGGLTKASTGYTFQFIQKHSDYILDCLLKDDLTTLKKPTNNRFGFYDATLLHLLFHKKIKATEIFTNLFRNNKAERVLAFLENESMLADELKIFAKLPVGKFSAAAAAIILQRFSK